MKILPKKSLISNCAERAMELELKRFSSMKTEEKILKAFALHKKLSLSIIAKNKSNAKNQGHSGCCRKSR